MGTIVITGSTGKLGSALSIKMKDVVLFNREDYVNPKPKLKDAEIIIHIAGGIYGSWDSLYAANVQTTKTLIENAPNLKRFIYVSTAVEDGDYTTTKRIAEDFIRCSGIPYVILRPTGIVFDDDNRLYNQLFHLIKKYPVVPLFGGGKQLAHPVWYGDVVRCIINSIKIRPNQTIYVAGGQVLSFRDIVLNIAKRLNKKPILLPLPKFLVWFMPFLSWSEKKRFFDNKVYPIDKMKKILKVNPIRFDEMVKEVKI